MRALLLLVWAFAPVICHAAAPGSRVLLTEDYQVLQRDMNDEAACTALLPPKFPDSESVSVCVADAGGQMIRQMDAAVEVLPDRRRGVPMEKLPVGGPYSIAIAARGRPDAEKVRLQNILVGDIWILGGQSNMYGIDVIKEALPALPYVNMLNLMHVAREAHWCAGLPPIHRIPEPFAQFTLKSQHPEYSEQQIRELLDRQIPVGGIDCSYFFARQLFAESRVPIGLIPCATGAALAHWNPDERERNRYGFLAHHVESAGGRVKGLLFFQGEQDAIFGDEHATVTKPSLIAPISTYGEQFIHFVEALRRDFGGPDMPVIYAQICRHHNSPADRSRGWEIVREAQRTIPDRLSHAHCVPTIHLDLMDGLHLDYDSLKIVGEQMADLAAPYVTPGAPPRAEIRLKSAAYTDELRPRILVEFTGVRGRLTAGGRPTGFVLKDRQSGKSLDWIYKTEFDPARPGVVVLHATSIPDANVVLYYGAGAAPYVNIVDDCGRGLPAFGPVDVQGPVPSQ